MIKQLTRLVLLAALPAWGSPDSTVHTLSDVEVVAYKQTRARVAAPVTNLDSALIERLDITGVRDLGDLAPNLYIPDYGSRMTTAIYMRGLGTRLDQPSVGLKVDNVTFLNKDNYDFDIDQIDRIEIQRGTDGVINGRNSPAGQINIYTLSPWTTRGLRARLTYGRGNTTDASAGYYTQLSRRVAAALTARYGHSDGLYRNDETGRRVGRENTGGARFKLSWHPASRWSLLNVATVDAGRQDGYAYEALSTRRIEYTDPTFYRRTALTDGLTVTYTGRRMTAASVTSLQYSNDNMTLDQDFGPQPFFTITQKRRETAFSEDFYAKGTRGCYNWLIGAFGFYKRTHMDAPVNFGDTGIGQLIEDPVNAMLPKGMQLRWDQRSMLLDSRFNISNGGFALYHQSAWTLGRWTLQGGLRWDIERVAMRYNSAVNTSVTMYRTLPTGAQIPLQTMPLAIDTTGRPAQSFNELMPQLAVGYDGGRWNLSLRGAKGYKAGGYNTQMFSDFLQQQLMAKMGRPVQYDIEKTMSYHPEKAWTFELSASWHDAAGGVNIQATGFVTLVNDQQLTVFPPGMTTGRAMTNAGRTRSTGVELQTMWMPHDGFSLSAAYGYTHAVFTRYNDGVSDLKGKRLPYAPAHTLSATAHYSLPWSVAGCTPAIMLNTRAAGNIFWDDLNTVSQPFYATFNGAVELNHPRFSLSIWADNITDTRHNVFYFVSMGNAFVQRAKPFTAGATLRLNFQTL